VSTPSLSELSSTDKAFYAALKLHVYSTIHDSLLSTLLGGTAITINESVKLEVGRFTARKTNNLFVPENGHRAEASAEFYGFTSHKVREKLMSHEERGVLELTGKGLRDAFTYKWKPPVKHWEICSFLKFKRATEKDLSMNHELHRVYGSLGFEPFRFADFVRVYGDAHSEEYASSRWGKRKFEAIRDSYAYQSFLKGRLDKLVEHKLVVEPQPSVFTLNQAIGDEINHFGLFLNEVAYHPSRQMCDVCKLDRLCRAGSTQLLIVALNKTTPQPLEQERT